MVTRAFSSAHDSPFGPQFMEVDPEAQKQSLMERQIKFDKDPTNPKHAYKYFRELNRHQKFLTVRRLYEKKETEYRTGD